MKKNYFKSAFVLGGSSTTAKAICIKLAENGCKKFHLVSRNLEAHQQLIRKLRVFYKAEVSEEKNDLLLNTSLVNNFKPSVDFYDIYLISSGLIGNNNLANSNSKEALKINFTNYAGIIPWLIEIMTEERIEYKGSLWILSSVASDRGRPQIIIMELLRQHYLFSVKDFFFDALTTFFSKDFKAGYISTPMASGAPKFLCTSPSKLHLY